MGFMIEVRHRTGYVYERAVALGPQVVQLRPAAHCRTAICGYGLTVVPESAVVRWQFDALGNRVARVLVGEKTAEFAVEVRLTADLTPYNPFDFVLEPGCESYPFRYVLETSNNLAPYRFAETAGPLLSGFLSEVTVQRQGTVGFLGALNAKVRDEVGYETRLEHGVQSCEETLERQMGSCRDSAWLLVQVLRHLGFASRFVSGYLIQLAEEDGSKPDRADLHAWAEVFLPGAGWVGLDATSGLFTAEGHIPLACTPTPSQAAPVWGTVERASVEFTYEMVVTRVGVDAAASVEAPVLRAAVVRAAVVRGETARLSAPYNDEEWRRVREVAYQVDRELVEQDVRLTMGGEPTFVGLDEPESLQWSVEALGDVKRTRGLALIRSLRERTAPGGLLHFGQGKWYPGEPLPRWAFQCISRLDGVAVWEDAELIAREEDALGYEVGDGFRFMEGLADRLQVSRGNVLAAFDPGLDSTYDGAQEAVGYVLPLRRRQPEGRLAWSSQLWFERPEWVVLSYGDSPIGYRIPVEMMPFVAPDELEYEMDEAGAVRIPGERARRMDLFGVAAEEDALPKLSGTAETAKELIRPSLCVQVREGRLCVFLPYVPVLADWLDLVAAVEDTAAYLGVKVWVEGYAAPQDGRLRVFGLTPDPGVLEVNLPPTSGWDELEELNRVLGEEAEKNRLSAGKFGFDGSQLATGGGSHIVLGAKTVMESPVLRRPDLLRSMVAFWQHHPSLSYLFSGMYVGPTSQYPRVDEARTDALYELELSFSQLPKDGCPPHILDGLFRNLLVDVTGNTHRAEFCIDKMWPPEYQGLRAGLLELRAFEMAPHYKMGMMQMLLVRALVSMLWRAPFEETLVRWGAALHDRFMLPYFVERDFAEVLGALREAGYGFEDGWFGTHLEFRFPKIGSVVADGVEVELRQALEPWNVLAEETNSGRTGRSVDSSLERMQVRVNGLSGDGRYVVSCNGRRVPLTSAGIAGEAVAAVRYRARRLSAALHPTVPVHTPLVFELIEVAESRVVAGCTYFAGPPDGRVRTRRPKDAEEARARRLERFVVSEVGGERVAVPAEETNGEFPMTLDLRWPGPGAAGVKG